MLLECVDSKHEHFKNLMNYDVLAKGQLNRISVLALCSAFSKIFSKIFNFSSTLLDLDYHQFHNNPSPCECNISSHLYEPYGHVITGDLSIIPNSKLRDLIGKGPKYREPCKVDWDKNLSLLCEAVDQYALQWAKREIVELSVLSSWKEMVKGQIERTCFQAKTEFQTTHW